MIDPKDYQSYEADMESEADRPVRPDPVRRKLLKACEEALTYILNARRTPPSPIEYARLRLLLSDAIAEGRNQP